MRRRILIIGAAVMAVIVLLMLAGLVLPMDFSQDWREIEGIDTIVFQRNGYPDRFYERCFWGLKKVPQPEEFLNYQEGNYEAEKDLLLGYIDCNHEIRQAVLSPDGNYILYCEIVYNYKKKEMTDDEYCYYRVYDIEKGKVITIYQAYREWYNLDWQ